MSIQRLNWFERNIEKIVAGVAGASLLGVVAYQLSRPPTEVEVMRKQVPMEKVRDVLKQHADEVRVQASDADADRDLRSRNVQTDMAAAFAARLTGMRSVALAGTWPTNPVPGGGSTQQIGEAVRLTVPALAVLSKPVVRTFWSTIHPSEIAAAPELSQLIAAKEAPFDHPGVSVELSLNGQRLRELLRGANIQPFWYEPTTAVVAVQIEREEQQPDGTWSAATVLPPMPGRTTLVERLRQNEFDDRSLAETAFSLATEIQRPAWYRQAVLKGAEVGMAYVSPMDAERVGDAQGRIRTLRQDIDQIDARIRALETELNRLRQQGGGTPQPGRGPGGGAGGGGIGGGGGGGGIGGGGGGRPPASGPQQARIQELERRVDEFQRQRQDKLDEIERLRNPAPTAPAVPPTPTGMQDRGVSPILLSNDVRLLAHDPSAKPGRTYRYRAIVKLTNPVFARGNFIAENQAALTEQLTISTVPSDWSAAVRVDDRTYFFVTSATGPNPLASGGLIQNHSAAAEVFTFTWGHWRSGRVNLTPGDIIAAKVTIPDFKRIEAEGGHDDAAPPQDPGQPPPGLPPGGPGGREGPSPGGGPGAGGGGIGAPGGGGLTPGGGGAPGGGPRPGGQPAPAPVPVLPSTDMLVSTEAFLLDVVPVAQGTIGIGGGARTLFIAVVREEAGRIVHLPPVTQRLPDNEPGLIEHNERISDYQRLQRAAEDGAGQLRAGAGTGTGSGS